MLAPPSHPDASGTFLSVAPGHAPSCSTAFTNSLAELHQASHSGITEEEVEEENGQEALPWGAEYFHGEPYCHKTFLFQKMLRGSREKIKHCRVFKCKSPLCLCSNLMNAQTTRQMTGKRTLLCWDSVFHQDQ